MTMCEVHHFSPYNIIAFNWTTYGGAVCVIRCSKCGKSFRFEMTPQEVEKRLTEMELERIARRMARG